MIRYCNINQYGVSTLRLAFTNEMKLNDACIQCDSSDGYCGDKKACRNDSQTKQDCLRKMRAQSSVFYFSV